jgi:hypothetical protein
VIEQGGLSQRMSDSYPCGFTAVAIAAARSRYCRVKQRQSSGIGRAGRASLMAVSISDGVLKGPAERVPRAMGSDFWRSAHP